MSDSETKIVTFAKDCCTLQPGDGGNGIASEGTDDKYGFSFIGITV